MARDSVDELLDSWAAQRPDLDFSPVGVVSRLGRVRSHIASELDRVFAEYGLGAATFGVLVTLARIGGERGVSQRRLMDELGLTSGTISVRMDRLVEEGLVERRPDPESRRNSLITLTARGRALFERVVPAHLANERRLLAALDPAEQATLAALLSKLLVEFEGSCAPARLGLTLAPAHVTIALREAVGLPAVEGLLVRTADGPAADAGLRTGDVLLVRSIAELEGSDGDLRVRFMRGTEEHETVVTPAAAGPVRRAPRGEHAL